MNKERLIAAIDAWHTSSTALANELRAFFAGDDAIANIPPGVAVPTAKKNGKVVDHKAIILASIGDKLVGMRDIEQATQLRAAQIRKPLEELIDSGEVEKLGEKRGTRYRLAVGAEVDHRGSPAVVEQENADYFRAYLERLDGDWTHIDDLVQEGEDRKAVQHGLERAGARVERDAGGEWWARPA